MDKKTKVIGGIVIAGAVVATGVYCYNKHKKNKAKQEKDSLNKLKDVKPITDLDKVESTDKKEEPKKYAPVPVDCERIAYTLCSDPQIDVDWIMTEDINMDDEFIRVIQSDDLSSINIMLQIPDYVNDRKAFRIPDFISNFSSLKREIVKLAGMCPEPKTSLDGWICLTPNNSEELIFKKFEEAWYKSYATERHDGQSAFYENLMSMSKDEVNDWTLDSFDAEFGKAMLTYTFSFPIYDPETGIGLKADNVSKILKFLMDNVGVVSSGTIDKNHSVNDTFSYDHIICHGVNHDKESKNYGKPSLKYYYEIGENKEGNVALLRQIELVK